MKITIEHLEFPLSVKDKITKIPKIYDYLQSSYIIIIPYFARTVNGHPFQKIYHNGF